MTLLLACYESTHELKRFLERNIKKKKYFSSKSEERESRKLIHLKESIFVCWWSQRPIQSRSFFYELKMFCRKCGWLLLSVVQSVVDGCRSLNWWLLTIFTCFRSKHNFQRRMKQQLTQPRVDNPVNTSDRARVCCRRVHDIRIGIVRRKRD